MSRWLLSSKQTFKISGKKHLFHLNAHLRFFIDYGRETGTIKRRFNLYLMLVFKWVSVDDCTVSYTISINVVRYFISNFLHFLSGLGIYLFKYIAWIEICHLGYMIWTEGCLGIYILRFYLIKFELNGVWNPWATHIF